MQNEKILEFNWNDKVVFPMINWVLVISPVECFLEDTDFSIISCFMNKEDSLMTIYVKNKKRQVKKKMGLISNQELGDENLPGYI